MVNVRPPQSETEPSGQPSRLNMLVSYAGWNDETWVDHLPRLLSPMGVRCWRAASGCEAQKLLRDMPIHIAVVDLSLPLESPGKPGGDLPGPPEGGPRLLELLARLETPPPTLIVKRRRTQREDVRDIASALRAGAFAVLERPVQLETFLETMRRVLRRYYADRWPGNGRHVSDN